MGGSAIYCIKCQYIRDGLSLHIILGSITTDGVLIIKRAHNQITRIQFRGSLSLFCDCGYQAYFTPSNPTREVSEYGQTTI